MTNPRIIWYESLIKAAALRVLEDFGRIVTSGPSAESVKGQLTERMAEAFSKLGPPAKANQRRRGLGQRGKRL